MRKAVLPVAGLGTRFLPATKAVPKEMLPLVDRPLIEYAVDEARRAGIEEFVVVTAESKPAIQNHFARDPDLEQRLREEGKEDLLPSIRPPRETFSFVQQTAPLGLGHAIWSARRLVGDEPFAVLLPDDVIKGARPCLAELLDVHGEYGGSVVALEEVDEQNTHLYGIVEPGARSDNVVDIEGIVEKPLPGTSPSRLGIVGRYVLDPEVMQQLDRLIRVSSNEVQLTDAITAGAAATRGVMISGRRFDCGTKAGYLAATVAYALDRDDLGDVRALLTRVMEASA